MNWTKFWLRLYIVAGVLFVGLQIVLLADVFLDLFS